MVFLSTTEDEVVETVNVNDKLWKFGFKFGAITLTLADSASKSDTLTYYLDINIHKLMSMRYKYSFAGFGVTYRTFYFSMFGRQLYDRDINRKENWSALYDDETLKIIRTTEVDPMHEGQLYDRLFILTK